MTDADKMRAMWETLMHGDGVSKDREAFDTFMDMFDEWIRGNPTNQTFYAKRLHIGRCKIFLEEMTKQAGSRDPVAVRAFIVRLSDSQKELIGVGLAL